MYLYDEAGQIVGHANPPVADEHETTVVENHNGTYGWECSCGDEADEFEDFDAADTDADEHRQNNA
jgi:hypothetical protein